MDLEKQVLSLSGIKEFNPMQAKALKNDWRQKSLVVSAPTASGKTLLAEIASLNSIVNRKRKVIYTCPLRALATEHWSEFKRKYGKELRIRAALSTGDLDSSSSYLQNYDLIFTTYEKCLPYNEFIVYREDNALRVEKIGEFFKHLEDCSRKISLNGKEQLIPEKDFFALSFSEDSKRVIFSKIDAVIKTKNSEPVLNLTFDSGRHLSLTASHKLFSLEDAMVKKVDAKDALGRHFLALASLEGVLDHNLKRLDLVKFFSASGLENELGVIFSSVDFEELWKALANSKRERRRAKELAKYYIKQKFLPLHIARRLKTIKVAALTGRRNDAFHRMHALFNLSKEFGKFLGYFISEGSFSTSSKRFGFKHLRFPMIEKRMIDDLLLLCKKLNFPSRYYPKNQELHVVSRPLFYLLSDVFKIGENAAQKALPADAFFFNKDFIKGLLEGLFAGDGGPSPRAIEYSTKNYKLALQVSLLLASFNIHSYIYPQKVKGRTCTYWRVCVVGGKNLKRFSRVVKRTKPIIEKRVQELINAKNARDDLFENVPVRSFFSHWPKVATEDHAVYMAWYRGNRASKPTFKNFAQKHCLGDIEKMLASPIGFLRCISNRKTETPTHVYNIQTSEGNFFTANGLLVKNCDSLLRHRADWLSSIGLLVIDEVHSLGSDRGPTIEMAVTKLRQINPELQVLALSATIPNAREIAEWLLAELVESDYRPIPLREGIFFDGEIDYGKGDREQLGLKEPMKAIVKDTVFNKGKQAMVFANTRKRAEGIARQLAPLIEKGLEEKAKATLQNDSLAVLNALEQPTEQCRRLSELVAKGVAFHHAGLVSRQRTAIEDAFRANRLKLISATPTLCLAPETKVWTGVHESRVDSFDLSHSLLALKSNRLVSVAPKLIIKRRNNRNIVTIQSVSGFLVRLTDNHRVLLKRGGKKVLVSAGNCKKGDKIATVGVLPKAGSKEFSVGHFTAAFSGPPLEMTEDLFYFVGAMLGDGYSGIESKSGEFIFKGSPCLTGQDKEIFHYAKKVCDFYGITYRETKNFYGVPCLVFSKKKWFRLFLGNCGVQKGAKKFIAKDLILASKASIRALMQGLFDTDGYVNKGKNIGFSNISFSLIQDLQRLLLLFGVVSRLRERKESVITVSDHSYKTKKYFELIIAQRKSILNFYRRIGFRVKRKNKALESLAKSIKSGIHYVSCGCCKYKLFSDLFSGRSKHHKEWGKRKQLIIKELGEVGKLTSSDLAKKLGFLPYKKEKRLNHHFELIKRTRVGSTKVWELNAIGRHVYQETFKRSKNFDGFFNLKVCPLCNKKLSANLRENWRKSDFEGDLFWDFVSKVSKETKEKCPFVFDVVLPSNSFNDHLFVAAGFLVHNSAGVNLPSHTVIIPSLYRYAAAGMVRIPVSEYKQCVGRAGRPSFDSEGRGIVIARAETEKEKLFEQYVNGSIEVVESQLGFEPVLRMHMLALIASGFVFDLTSMEEFFKKTFYAKQFGEMQALFEKLQEVLQQLEEMDFIQSNEKRIEATALGRRVSELYLDPLSAFDIIKGLRGASKFSPLSYLFLLGNCSEMMPWLSVPKTSEAGLWEQLQFRKRELPVDIEREMFFDLNLLKKFNTSLMFEQWIEEVREQAIMDDFKTQPGTLHAKLSIADWLCYSMLELARLLRMESHYSPLGKLRKRLKHGVKEELVFLTEVKYIGRVRARRLWRSNIRTIAELKKLDEADLSKILGLGVAKKIKAALGQS